MYIARHRWRLPQVCVVVLRSIKLFYILVNETEDLAGNVLATSLLVVHDTSGGGEDDVSELTGGQQVVDPVLNVTDLDVEAGRDDTDLVEAAVELDNDLAAAVVVDVLKVVNVA